MMRFRRKRTSFSSRRRAEPIFWQRLPLTPTAVGVNNFATQVLFDPTTVTTGNEDARITVLRIKMVLPIILTSSGTPGTDNFPNTLLFGISVLDRNVAVAPAPNLASNYDKDTDWLALWAVQPSYRDSARNVVVYGDSWESRNFDFKVKRKLKMTDTLVLTNTNQFTGGATNATLSMFAITSVLWQRSLR